MEKTLDSLQNKYKSDVIGFGNMIYKKYPDKWKSLEKDWNKKHFKDLKFDIKTDFTIESTGSLDQTIEEVLQ